MGDDDGDDDDVVDMLRDVVPHPRVQNAPESKLIKFFRSVYTGRR